MWLNTSVWDIAVERQSSMESGSPRLLGLLGSRARDAEAGEVAIGPGYKQILLVAVVTLM